MTAHAFVADVAATLSNDDAALYRGGQLRARPRRAVPVQDQRATWPVKPTAHALSPRWPPRPPGAAVRQSRDRHSPHRRAGHPHDERPADASSVTMVRQTVLANSPPAAREDGHRAQGTPRRQRRVAQRLPDRAVPQHDQQPSNTGASARLHRRPARCRTTRPRRRANRREPAACPAASAGRSSRRPVCGRWARLCRRFPAEGARAGLAATQLGARRCTQPSRRRPPRCPRGADACCRASSVLPIQSLITPKTPGHCARITP